MLASLKIYAPERPCVLTEMAVAELITDPALLSLLSSSQKTLAHILEILSWVDQNQSAEPASETQLTLSKYQKSMIVLLAQLRGQNRQAISRVRATKQETAEARQEVDRLLLQLQNLYYEQRHLMGEIGACEGYEYVHTPELGRSVNTRADIPSQSRIQPSASSTTAELSRDVSRST